MPRCDECFSPNNEENDTVTFKMEADFSEARDPKILWSISLSRSGKSLFFVERSQDFLV